MSIALSIGKKGSGKSALLRKLVWRVHQTHRSALTFYHDPQCQIRGPVFTSTAQWRASKNIPPLSVFRSVEVEDLAQLARDVGDVTLVLDELDFVSNDKKWTAPTVKQLVHYGRHYRVSLFGGFRRTQNVPEDILSQADHIFLFKHEPRAIYDVRVIRDRFGQAYADAVTQLEPGQFVIAT